MGCAHEEERARKSGVGGRWLRGIVPQGRGEAAGGGEGTGRPTGSEQQPRGSESRGSGTRRGPGPGLKHSHYPAATQPAGS